MTTEQLEKYFGNAIAVAAFFNITPEAFYQWKKRDKGLIPKGRAAEAALRTGNALKFNPSLYQQDTKTS